VRFYHKADDDRCKNLLLFAIVESELKLADVAVQVLHGDFVKRAYDAALQQGSEAIHALRRNVTIVTALNPPAIMLKSENLLCRSWEVHGDARIRNNATPEIPVSKLLARRLV
jgi:hypothetical protein